jgi:mannose-6-phosphate isomerase-like protein (cupin superfamily)
MQETRNKKQIFKGSKSKKYKEMHMKQTEDRKDPRGGKKTVKSVRPWGDIHMVVRNQKCSVDLTHVKPGERASLHSHEVRTELFHFLDDGAYLEIDGEISRPKAHDEVVLYPGMKHRFWADETDFRMLVVCFEEWTVEDQVRHEDDYGREGTKLKL